MKDPAVFIRSFADIGLSDLASVGGKNASLGEMYRVLRPRGIRVPNGFAVTAQAFRHFLDENNLTEPLTALLAGLDRQEYSNLADVGARARRMLRGARLPHDLAAGIREAWEKLCAGDENASLAVRSSATAEDLPDASFAGQHESFLNVQGYDDLLDAVQRCFASLYTDRAIKYREDKGFEHQKVALSVGVQRMVRSDRACSGIAFTIDPESGFRDVVMISGVWGLGENIVQGAVTPDEFYVFKPTLRAGKNALVMRRLGEKAKTMVYAGGGPGGDRTVNTETAPEKRRRFVLNDAEVRQIAEWSLQIEEHYGKPMDLEWAKDGLSGELFVVQARPETVASRRNPYQITTYKLESQSTVLARGQAVGSRITTGIARVLRSPDEAWKLKPGEIVVTGITSPDWDPILKQAGGIVTDKGGRTSHASIVARELGVAAVVGTGNATRTVTDGQPITISCAESEIGKVYEGKLEWTEQQTDLSGIALPQTAPMLIVADPGQAFKLSFYPSRGVGLMRLEFVINNSIGIHPMALAHFEAVTDPAVRTRIQDLTAEYADKKAFFIERLTEAVATIACAFYPRDVIVRMSDFKTNEYAHLLGGQQFEPAEENPMLGFRGASRYYSDTYRDGFLLECAAMKKVRDEMGLTNVKLMIPFCRTVEEGRKVTELMAENGLRRGENGLEVYVMVEIPSNVLLAGQFADVFDGFSIGSNDLTQLTLGLDRDSAQVSGLFSEKDPAVMQLIAMAIRAARKKGIKIGLCGQAPSDMPEFARFLVDEGIDSISFNADALLKGIENMNAAEKTGDRPAKIERDHTFVRPA
jgi:pyruvate,water dikinase